MKRNFIGSQSTKDLRYMKYLLIVRIFVALRYCGIPSHSVFCLFVVFPFPLDLCVLENFLPSEGRYFTKLSLFLTGLWVLCFPSSR